MRLPHAYTELHAQVSSSTSKNAASGGDGGGVLGVGSASGRVGHPAVCLVCGEVLDASGRGQCTRHARECGCGVGLFFLLQVRSGLVGDRIVGRAFGCVERWVSCVFVDALRG